MSGIGSGLASAFPNALSIPGEESPSEIWPGESPDTMPGDHPVLLGSAMLMTNLRYALPLLYQARSAEALRLITCDCGSGMRTTLRIYATNNPSVTMIRLCCQRKMTASESYRKQRNRQHKLPTFRPSLVASDRRAIRAGYE